MNVNSAATTQQVGPPPGGRPPGGGHPMKGAMDAAAETLGLEPEELKSALDEGSTLADLASAAGVSTDDLKAAMTAALEETAPAEAAERLSSKLDDVIAGDRPPRPPRGGGRGGGQTDVNEAIGSLASALDTSTEDLLASIQAGSLSELFSAAGLETQSGVLVNTDL